MALRTLRVEPDEILRKKSKPVIDITASVLTLLDDMRDTMSHYGGVGLAAPQVGVLKRIILIEDEDVFIEMLNPHIILEDGEQTSEEACLSVPYMVGSVPRPLSVCVSYTNRFGDGDVYKASDNMSIIVSHEIDHLDGVLYKDKALPGTFRENTQEYEKKKKRPGRAQSSVKK